MMVSKNEISDWLKSDNNSLDELFTKLEEIIKGSDKRHKPTAYDPVSFALKQLIKNYNQYKDEKQFLLTQVESFSEDKFAQAINELQRFEEELTNILSEKSTSEPPDAYSGLQTLTNNYSKYLKQKKELEEIIEIIEEDNEEQTQKDWDVEIKKLQEDMQILEQQLTLSSILIPPAVRTFKLVQDQTRDTHSDSTRNDGMFSVESLSDEEVQGILSLIDSHPKRFTEDFLREKGVPFSSNLRKAELAERLERAYIDKFVSASDLVGLLDRIEGWGNQQIFLYTAHESAYEQSLSTWLDESTLREHLRQHNLEDRFNRNRPLFIPEKRTLSTIAWSEEKVRIVWVERREHQKTLLEEITLDDLRKAAGGFLSPRIYDLWDRSAEEVYFEAYTKIPTRGLTVFEWDIRHNQAMLLIQKLPSGTNYEAIRQEIHLELAPILDISQFELVQVSKAIRRIEHEASDEERRRRQLIHRKDGAARGTFTSAGQGQDVYESFEPSLKALGEVISVQGDFIWLPVDDKPSTPVYTKIYRRDESISILKRHLEDDVRDVLSRIRSYCG